MKKNDMIVLRLVDDEKEAIKKIAELDGRTLAGYVRKLILDDLKKNQKR